MNKKTISIISYLTIAGWLISFIIYHSGGRSAFAQYHLRQSFGLGVFGAVTGMAFFPILQGNPLILYLCSILVSTILIVLIFGIANAVNQKQKPLPVIGTMFVDRFNFIKY